MISYRYSRRALYAAIVLLPLIAAAQAIERDPLNPQAAVSSAPYQSAFTDYQSYQDPELTPWRTANDAVGQAGGMAGHNMGNMKEMGDQKKMENMPGDMNDMNGKEKMADMPGHDMGSMKGNAAPLPATKPAPSGKPAERAPQTMPNHGGMQKP